MLETVADVVRQRRSQGWVVGGCVRDRGLGRYSPDLDVVVADDAGAVAKAVAATLQVPWFALSDRHRAYRVLGHEGCLDVSPVRAGGIAADLALRDFTVNAMAVPVDDMAASALDGTRVIDPFGGLEHLRRRLLVAVSEDIFADDPLRLMRAPRFCHVLGFRPDEALADSIRGQAARLVNAAPERVAAEMVYTLAEGRTAEVVQMWHDLGLFVVLLPETLDGAGLGALLALAERLDDLLARPHAWFPETAALLAARLAEPVDGMVDRPVALRLATLTHGLEVGTGEAFGRRLHLSGEMLALLQAASPLLENDGDLPASPAGRDAVLFLWDSAPWEPEALILVSAVDRANLDQARRLMSLWAEWAVDGTPEPPVDGEWIMREFELQSGPLVGKVLRELRLAWQSGEIDGIDGVRAVARGVVDQQ